MAVGVVVASVLLLGASFIQAYRTVLCGHYLMNSLAISAEHLSKVYDIGARQGQHNTLRDRLSSSLKSLARRNNPAVANNNSGRYGTFPSMCSAARSLDSSAQWRRQEHVAETAFANHGSDGWLGQNYGRVGSLLESAPAFIRN